MKLITKKEFEKLPKKAPTVDLESGKFYYILDTKADPLALEDNVYIGKFSEKIGNYFDFEDIDVLVTDRTNTVGKPTGFKNTERYKFMEVISDEPTSTDIQHKKENIQELQDYISLKRAEPHDETPTVSFFGKDYRSAKERFEDLQKQQTNKSLPKSKGGKITRRKKHRKINKKGKSQKKMIVKRG